MIFTQNFTYNTGGLFGLAAEVQAQAVHSEKNAALHGLKAVPHVRKGT